MNVQKLKIENAMNEIEIIRVILASKSNPSHEYLSEDILKLMNIFDNLKKVDIDHTPHSCIIGQFSTISRLAIE